MSHYTVGAILDKNKIDQDVKNAVKNITDITNTVVPEEKIKELKFLAIQHHTEKALEPFYEGLEVESYVDATVEEVKQKLNEIKSYTEEEMEEQPRKRYLYDNFASCDLESFALKYYESELTDEGVMSTYNPNSKWDWYIIGGRWANELPTIGKKPLEERDSYTDDINSFARIKDILFTRDIPNEEQEMLKETYEKMMTKGDFYKPEYYQRKYPTFDDFVKSKTTYSTYALLTSDGTWHEPGRMGWFGMSSAEPEEEKDFKETYKELILKENPENYFVLVDCHI